MLHECNIIINNLELRSVIIEMNACSCIPFHIVHHILTIYVFLYPFYVSFHKNELLKKYIAQKRKDKHSCHTG